MLKFKNLTTNELAALLAIGLALLLDTILFLVNYSYQVFLPLLVYLVVPFVFGFIAYIIIFYLFQYYVFRRIKVLYKLIRNFRTNKEENNPRQRKRSKNFLEKVEQEVEDWSRNQKAEFEHLKELENYRRDYIGNVAHELKTPVFNIQGYLGTLINGGLEDPNININYLKRANQNVQRLATILEDLDAISKLESGKILMDVQKFDIKILVQEVYHELDYMAKENKVNLGFKSGANSTYLVSADRESIRQVLTNLISNSVKYGNQGGATVTSFYDMHNYVLVEVMDNGIGIEQKHLKHIFDRFYRIDKARSRKQGGSGLGLSIVKHILEAHEETIAVRSTPGVGTTFSFTLKKG